jgi:hypothetical protein
MWFTVVDGRGRIRWTETQPGWDVLVLVCRATSADYLGFSGGSASVIWSPVTNGWIWPEL